MHYLRAVMTLTFSVTHFYFSSVIRIVRMGVSTKAQLIEFGGTTKLMNWSDGKTMWKATATY